MLMRYANNFIDSVFIYTRKICFENLLTKSEFLGLRHMNFEFFGTLKIIFRKIGDNALYIFT